MFEGTTGTPIEVRSALYTPAYTRAVRRHGTLGWGCLALLLASCAAHRPASEVSRPTETERSLRARINLAKGEAAVDSRQWGLAAGYFAVARVEQDSLAAQWGHAWATSHAWSSQ